MSSIVVSVRDFRIVVGCYFGFPYLALTFRRDKTPLFRHLKYFCSSTMVTCL